MRNLIVVCGTSGCGKSTIGAYLAKKEGCTFLEGDDFHPQANRDKMHASRPLTDEDRHHWLERLSASCIDALSTNSMIVVTCSALKQKYRDIFRNAVGKDNDDRLGLSVVVDHIQLDFIFLHMAQDKASHLVHVRALSTGHFMPASLVGSQFDILELPGEEELDCHVLDSNVGTKQVMECTVKVLESVLAQA